MKLGELIYTRQNIEKLVHTQLLAMDVWFQEHLWDGYSDENDPKFISNEDFEAIQALTDKIEHMTFNIGCGISVEPMLQSVCQRKIKHWQADNNVETKDIIKYSFDKEKRTTHTIKRMGFRKGKQLKNNDELRRVYTEDGYYHIKPQDRIISGHFRWNNRGYILSRRATDLLAYYCEYEF